MLGELSTRQLIGAFVIAGVAAVLVCFGCLYAVDHWILPRGVHDTLTNQRGLKPEQPALAK